MSNAASAIYFCDACGKTAGSVELSVIPDERLCLRVVGPVVDASFFLEADAQQHILTALRDKSPHALFNLHPEYAPFFCPDCTKNYCKDCWRMIPIFDDDFPGWYDSTEGYCPQGHRRLMDD